MKEFVPMNVFERLEREWRMIDPERPTTSEQTKQIALPQRRLRINRFDDAQIQRSE
ncbi:hypothetical protein [Rhizobium sp. WL3]|uniref:hypothetical protein n=1 Tax=Rhizobium sp. WL3 TaxID=2603277 RepID=UPI001650531B|nr:hypothetical protein [Rhizobium sp. WL3]